MTMLRFSTVATVTAGLLISIAVIRPATADTKKLSDVAYGSDAAQTMDVYIPDGSHNAPIIVMVHGGAWAMGDKGSDRVVENKDDHWGAQGYIFVSVNYRLVPQANPLEQADDVAAALAKTQADAASWGGDPTRVILMGHSAGAHLVALLGANPSRAYKAGAKPWLGTVALDSGALNVSEIMQRRHYGFYDSAFGDDPNFWREASPTQQLTAQATPMLMVCSSKRKDSCPQAEAFVERAKSLGVNATLLPENLKHEEINEYLGLPGSYTNAVDAFIAPLVAKGPTTTQ